MPPPKLPSPSSMAHNYLVTAHQPTAVNACATGGEHAADTPDGRSAKRSISSLFPGYFTGEDDLNLVLAKNNMVEILKVTPEGLRTIKNFHINGKVEVLKFFRPPGAAKDRLFVVTYRHNAMILEVEGGSGPDMEIVTRAHGDVGDRIGKKSETGTLAVIDPEAR